MDGSAEYLILDYNTGLSSLIEQHAPLCKKTVTLRPHAPWYTEKLRQAKQDRWQRKLERRWRNSQLTVHKEAYRQQCAVVNRLLYQARITYYSKKIEECDRDQKMMHKVARHLLGENRGTVLPTNSTHSAIAEQFSRSLLTRSLRYGTNLHRILTTT